MSSAFKKRSELMKNSTKITIDVAQKTINEINKLIKDKLIRIQLIIQNTISQFHYYRRLDIISNSDLMICTSTLVDCYEKCVAMITDIDNGHEKYTHIDQIDGAINELQTIIDKLSIIMCGYGTKNIDDIFFISFGVDANGANIEQNAWRDKYHLIMQHIRPIGYKTIHWKHCKSKPKDTSDHFTADMPICKNKMTEDAVQIELSRQYECYDIDLNARITLVKIHGVRVVIHNEKTQKTLIVQGIVDDIPLEFVSNAYIHKRKAELIAHVSEIAAAGTDPANPDCMTRIIDSLTLKDILIYGNDDIYKRQMMVLSEVNYVKANKLNITIKRFLELDVYGQRHLLMHLLIYDREIDIQYITYLLYDLISSKTGGDSAEQQLIYDSFPWKIKQYFKDTMKTTIKYTRDMMSKYDINRISLEQQIYVMKAPENVKEKAMTKLKEIKGKADDSGAKAKQYLEGLLKIPFHFYKEEEILTKPKLINQEFQSLVAKHGKLFRNCRLTAKPKYTVYEIIDYIDRFQQYIHKTLPDIIIERLEDPSSAAGRKKNSNDPTLICPAKIGSSHIIVVFSLIVDDCKIALKKNATTKEEKIHTIKTYIKSCSKECMAKIYDVVNATENTAVSLVKSLSDSERLKHTSRELKGNLDSIVDTLDESIHGHMHAKNQILKIVAQWMNGEQSGYCFGFEGSPGIGKTSLAKRGLANCLKDENGESRPFAFIALGGSCNGSTLEGHSYTYVNSTWGRIVDILMDTKCMNPIIYIDELDKVSKTEHGKEIIGILTHLIDTTQNSVFQDKYFSGIDIDLSKVLFIFSYNDPSQIDSILLDRIHRIRFDSLSIEDKLVVVKKHILPEINRKMGLDNCVRLSDEVIEHLIVTYTLESGVRKLKEVLFDLYGEINLELMRCENTDLIELPIVLEVEDLHTKYLTKYDKINEKKIHENDEVGIINGLWANALGRGGIIPIQTMMFPTSTFLELRLTGMQGDVMKESMNVAKTLAWKHMSADTQAARVAEFEKTKCQGLHIHCPEGAVSKDGPSAGAAITIAIYSQLMGLPIKHNVAITGEINLQGQITEIGGLEHKVLGGIRAGIRKFLYPKSNQFDFDKIVQKYGDHTYMKEIVFVAVDRIEDAIGHFIEQYNQP